MTQAPLSSLGILRDVEGTTVYVVVSGEEHPEDGNFTLTTHGVYLSQTTAEPQRESVDELMERRRDYPPEEQQISVRVFEEVVES